MRLKTVGFRLTKMLAPVVGIAAGTGMLLSVGKFQEERGRLPPPSPSSSILPFGGAFGRRRGFYLPPPPIIFLIFLQISCMDFAFTKIFPALRANNRNLLNDGGILQSAV